MEALVLLRTLRLVPIIAAMGLVLGAASLDELTRIGSTGAGSAADWLEESDVVVETVLQFTEGKLETVLVDKELVDKELELLDVVSEELELESSEAVDGPSSMGLRSLHWR